MKNIWIIKLVFLLLCGILSCGMMHAQLLNMHVTHNRYLDRDGNTILLLDYQAVYNSLTFVARNGAFFAELEVQIQIANDDSTLISQTVEDNIGIINKYDASSQRKSYLNRLVYQLDESRFRLSINARDLNSGNVFFYDEELEAIPPQSRISDVELNVNVYADTTSYLQKFKRGTMVYEPIPSVLLSKNYSDYAHLYLELYSPEAELGSSYMLNLSLAKDSLYVIDEYLDGSFSTRVQPLSLKIPLADLEAGKYNGTISLQTGEIWENRDFEFVLSEDIERRFRIFEDAEEEYSLMRYFTDGNLPSNWEALDNESKTRYINNFWQNMASKTRMSEDDILGLVSQRVEYANQHFSSLKPGWTSDMGRIYIRNGAPADIEKGTSSDETRFVRKDYQIWKYSSGTKPVYLFIDIQMNNNFRLIYNKGDEMESSNPDWIRYLGTDFDSSLLRN